MKIGGLQKVTLLDFPGLIAAIVFTKGCNFRCPFCFNRDLVLDNVPTISQKAVLDFLKKRKKVLDGVVISGGEPTLQEDLADFLKKIKKLGYQVKLDTNGSLPEVLTAFLRSKLIDYVALDYKAPLDESYAQLVRQEKFSPETWVKSLKLLLASKVPFELRTTVVSGFHSQRILLIMARQLKKLFGKRKINWFWQNFQPKTCLDPEFEKKKPHREEKLEEFLRVVKKILPDVELRPS